MSEFKLITKEDIPNIDFVKINWDVNLNGVDYQVVRAPGFVHTIGGRLDSGNGNCYWAYPLNQKPSIENLIAFNGIPGARWGITYSQKNHFRNKYDECSIESGRYLVITRNDEVFYDGIMTIHEAMAYVLDGKLYEHPLDLNMRDFDKRCIARKIWYRSQPAIIKSYIRRQACIMIAPDGIDKFCVPAEYKGDIYIPYDEDGEIKTTIFDPHIWWFRD